MVQRYFGPSIRAEPRGFSARYRRFVTACPADYIGGGAVLFGPSYQQTMDIFGPVITPHGFRLSRHSMIWLRLRRTCIAGNETSTLIPSQFAVSSLRLRSFRPSFSFETALALFSKRLLETGILHAHLSIDPLQAVVLFSYRSDLKHVFQIHGLTKDGEFV